MAVIVVVFGIGHQVLANALPGLRAEPFDIVVQGRFLEALVEDTDSAKPSERSGVGDMKGQILYPFGSMPIQRFWKGIAN
jgi:hypothetical protein